MEKKDYAFLLASLWSPALIVGAYFAFSPESQHIPVYVEGFKEIISILVTLTGLIMAILIGVYTAIYVQSRSKRESGFDNFFSSLNDFTELMQNLQFDLRHFTSQKPKHYDEWLGSLAALVNRLHLIKPSWPGYDAEPDLENQMCDYAHQFKELCDSAGTDFQISVYPTRHDRFLKGASLGLLTMEEAIEGQKLSMRLTLLLPSFAFLLVLCFIARIVAELRLDLVSSQIANNINLALTSGLSTALIFHTLMSIFVIYHWQERVRIRDEAWAPTSSSPSSGHKIDRAGTALHRSEESVHLTTEIQEEGT